MGGAGTPGKVLEEKILANELPLIEGVRYLIPTQKLKKFEIYYLKQYELIRLNNSIRYAWYDVKNLSALNPERFNFIYFNTTHIKDSEEFLQNIIDEEVNTHLGGDYSRIQWKLLLNLFLRMILMGQSQGGFMAYHLSLISPLEYGLIVPMSCSIFPQDFDIMSEDKILYKVQSKAKKMKISHFHGEKDELFPMQEIKTYLKQNIEKKFGWKHFKHTAIPGTRHKAAKPMYQAAMKEVENFIDGKKKLNQEQIGTKRLFDSDWQRSVQLINRQNQTTTYQQISRKVLIGIAYKTMKGSRSIISQTPYLIFIMLFLLSLSNAKAKEIKDLFNGRLQNERVNEFLNVITLQPKHETDQTKQNQCYSILFLKGANGLIQEYMEKIYKGKIPLIEGVRYLMPSPHFVNPKSRNYKKLKNAWFDVYNLDYYDKTQYNMTNFNDSLDFLQGIIDNEVANHLNGDYKRLIIVGQSQGGMLTYGLTLASPHQYGLVVPMSTFVLPMVMDRIKGNQQIFQIVEKARTQRIFHIHSKNDALFSYDKVKKILNQNLTKILEYKEFILKPLSVDGVGHLVRKYHFQMANKQILKYIQKNQQIQR